ncbi:ABC transporter permease [Kitasatospora purpeofusca]|uniref:ABC transporter permease n=1 Tax=Kitasatospora purpeofusca TaxID=67352 RepID=UPI0037F2AC37
MRFPRRSGQLVLPSHLRSRDLLAEAAASLLQRPARSAMTALGTVLGVATFVAILGLTATASAQIDSRFNALTATEVTVENVGGRAGEPADTSFPADADHRIGRLNGVEHAGVYWLLNLPSNPVRAAPIGGASGGSQIPVIAASAGALEAVGPNVRQGRTFDTWSDSSQQQVAVIGSGIAAQLNITNLDTQPAVFIAGVPFAVVGIVDSYERKPDFLLSVIVPRGAASGIWGEPTVGDQPKMLITTQIGAAQQIAGEVPLALDPTNPDSFRSVPPPDPKSLRTNVTSDLNQLFILLAGICLIIGSVGITNTTLVAVLERTGEIGLRRALGARGRHIMRHFLTESAMIGFLGGIIGTSLGVLAVLGVSIAREWTPVVDPFTVLAAPGIGLLTGLVSGLYPAWRSARIEPAEALRR